MLCTVLSRLSFYDQLLEQLNVASLSGPTIFLLCYWFSLLLLFFGQINVGDKIKSSIVAIILIYKALCFSSFTI